MVTETATETSTTTVTITKTAADTSVEVAIGAEDNGKQVTVNSGDAVRLSLPGNPTTGYTWELVEIDENVLHQVGETEFEPGSGAIGAPAMTVLDLETVGTGQTSLKLVYHRPWEKEAEAADTFFVQVIVR